jgi:hypothetical protein
MLRFVFNKYKAKRQYSFAWVLFCVIMIAGGLDITGDYIEMFGISRFTIISDINYFQSLSYLLIVIIAVIGLNNIVRHKYAYRSGIGAKLFLLFFLASVIIGATVGLINGNPISYIVGDSRNIIIYLALFAINDIKYKEFDNNLYTLYFSVCAIVFVKLLIAFISFVLTMSSPLSARFLLKLTPYFIGLALINAALMTINYDRRKFIVFIIATISVVLSQTRGILLGYACGFLVLCMIIIYMKRGIRLITPVITILSVVLLLAVGVWFNEDATQGKWTGDTFDDTVNIRLEQMDSFMNLFKRHFAFGIGLGGYDPEYIRFVPETNRPYLQELEFHNLLAKLGSIGMFLWICSFISLFYECWRRIKKSTSMKLKGLISGFMAGLVGMLVASATNPYYSSIYFHAYIIIILLLLSNAMRLDKAVYTDS